MTADGAVGAVIRQKSSQRRVSFAPWHGHSLPKENSASVGGVLTLDFSGKLRVPRTKCACAARRKADPVEAWHCFVIVIRSARSLEGNAFFEIFETCVKKFKGKSSSIRKESI